MYITRAYAFTNGQSASLVIGQKVFTSTFAAASQSGLVNPLQVAFDSGKMWVLDSGNNRVLEFQPPFSTGMEASLVIGHPDFTSSQSATTQSGLRFITGSGSFGGFGFDSSGDMWVADYGNNRVLEFVPPFANGMSASIVIGQKDFMTANAGGSKNGLWQPNDVAFDGSGNMWVADASNNRVLEFVPPFSTGMNASLVIGQTNFENSLASTTQSGLTGSGGHCDLAFDPAGNLWVADGGNSRVLEFKPPFRNGINASLVIGQKDFATNTPSGGQAGLCNSDVIASDPAGNVWVGDIGNSRLLEFQPPFSTGMRASLVIGQSDFTSNTPGTTQSRTGEIVHPVFDSSGNLWVPDFSGNRVLEFTATPVPEFPTASLAIIALVSLAVVAVVSRRFTAVKSLAR